VDSPAPAKQPRLRRAWLPYWAVLRMDLYETFRSWLFRSWVLVTLVLCTGYLLHTVTVHQRSGQPQSAAAMMAQILQFILYAGSTLVILISAGTISSERETLADAVLCRGISRYQYFLGKLHSRLFTVIGSFLLITAFVLVGSAFLLRSDLDWYDSALCLLLVGSLLTLVVCISVAVSGMVQSTVLGIALVWIALYTLGAAMLLVPLGGINLADWLQQMPQLMRGEIELSTQWRMLWGCLITAALITFVGMTHFARKDV
jgi:ABC-2 type transport system permease protein